MNKLKAFREKYKLTQDELADLIKLSTSQVQRLENSDKKWGNKIRPSREAQLDQLEELIANYPEKLN
jgi:transcriptional regulator with XRE-family HTH domain